VLRQFLSSSSSSSGDHYGVQRISTVPCDDENGRLVSLEKLTLAEAVTYFDDHVRDEGAFQRLIDSYRIIRTFPDMSDFRLGPNMFERIPLDWIVCASGRDASKSRLIGHGIATRIEWNGNPRQLPRGWQGAVRECFQNHAGKQNRCNTHVGLFIKVEDEHRGHQWAERILEEMKRVGRSSGLSTLVIPLRLPKHYEREYAELPIERLADLRRDDGEHLDHWLRLHLRLGAEIIGFSNASHQHAMNLDDFTRQFECGSLDGTGYHLVAQHGEWYRAFVDLERDFALINQSCVWVRHRLQ